MTFRATSPCTVLDPYEWLPGSGESGVRFLSEGSDIVLQIRYDKATDEEKEVIAKRDLRFSHTCAFYQSSFPGAPGLIDISHNNEKFELGSLIEFQDSEVARNWEAHFSNRFKFRHYLIIFMSENLLFHVVAESFSLGPEQDNFVV
jgi:hypothetical protein